MRKYLLFICLIASLHGEVINIALAANVSYAIDEIKKEFALLHPKIQLNITLGSSGKLTAQIQHGAPYQLFMSANMQYPQALYENSLAVTKPLIYAQGSLAFLSVKKLDFSKKMALLEDENISKIAIANPKTAPYGKAALEALKNAHIYNKVKKKLIYGESISQTISYTVRATDIGLVAKSALFSPKMRRFKKGINWVDVESKLYTPIDQGIVILKNGKNSSGVQAFYDFILSQDAKKIFKDFGYTIP